MTNPTLLIIDDEPQIRKLLTITLESNEYNVIVADSAQKGIALAASQHPDLIVLDLGLPDKNGQDVLIELREWYDRPILILSVQDQEEGIVKALDAGASDYLTKPFRTGELLARIRACLRRNMKTELTSVFTVGDIELDLTSRTIKKKGVVLKLTNTEYLLMSLLIRHEGKVLTHQFILKEIWGVGYQQETQYLRVFIGTLRKKIEDDFSNPKYIITESGVGYRFI